MYIFDKHAGKCMESKKLWKKTSFRQIPVIKIMKHCIWDNRSEWRCMDHSVQIELWQPKPHRAKVLKGKSKAEQPHHLDSRSKH